MKIVETLRDVYITKQKIYMYTVYNPCQISMLLRYRYSLCITIVYKWS